MARPSYLLLIVLLFFAALLAIPSPQNGGEGGRPETVVLRMGSGPPPKGMVELPGKVINVVGWPVAGAQVTTGRGAGAGATTDADGGFRLRVAENEAVPLTVAARAGMHGRASAVLPQEDAVVLVAELPLPWSAVPDREPMVDSGLAGEGLVEDEEGRPVPNAVVIVPEIGVSVRADEHGRYRVPLPVSQQAPAGEAVFHLIARDRNSRVVRAEVEHTRQQQGLRPLPTLQVAAGHEVTGFLKDGSGDPVDGAGLVLSGEGQVRRVVTGAAGEFGIQGLLAGDYQLSALPHRGWVGFHRELSVGQGAPQDVELRLRPEHPLTILVENEAGEPQAEAYIVAHEADYRTAHGRTDAHGRVILRGLGDGKLTFTAHRGPDHQKVEVVRYDATEQRLILGQ
ncbi:MAG: carboxypeptidase regulatory-like domain-containing protein [Planctomycetota bacterium]|jgi:protocatechuate 3,4-dioxygenase beta subunit